MTAETDGRRKPDKETAVLEYHAQNPDASFRQIAEKFQTAHPQVARWIRKAEKSNRVKFIDKREIPEDMDPEDLFERMIALNHIISSRDLKQTLATVQLDDDRPIGIAFSGDWHSGARGADYELFKYHMQLLEETDGLYTVGMGDYKDNASALVHKDSVTEVVISPQQQEAIVKHFIRKICPIVLIRGCHDHWDHRLNNRDFVQELCDEVEKVNGKGAINLWHGGEITLLLGDQTYKIRARHKYKNESGLNVINSLRRMEDAFGLADVQVIAHKHDPFLFECESKGQKVIWARSGSYKAYDEFGQQIGGYRGKEAVVVVIFWPDTHKMLGFRKIEDAIPYLAMLRSESRVKEAVL